MAIDLEAIKRRVAELNGTAPKRMSSVQLWKPSVGEYKVRGLPWKDADAATPFKELWFYYIGNNPGILAPNQFGKPDPINDLIRKLYSSGKPADKEQAKKLQPKMRAYMPVVVRGEEDKGVQVWSFGKIVYQRLLNFYLDSDVGDILNPLEGFDLKVTISQAPGKQFMDTTVDAARKSSKLSQDDEQAQKWINGVPDLGDMYKLKSTDEIKAVLNSWLNGDVQPEVASPGPGTMKGNAPKVDELDSLVSEVKTQKKADESKAKKSLDDAFADLMS